MHTYNYTYIHKGIHTHTIIDTNTYATYTHTHTHPQANLHAYIHIYMYNTYITLHISTTSWPGSSVGIATGYGLDGPGRDFSHTTRPVLGLTQPPVQWVPGLLIVTKYKLKAVYC
jgi:hypothetical protein